MAYQTHGKHLIAGEWVGGEKVFTSNPTDGSAREFSVGTPEHVARAAAAAEAAFADYAATSRADRARFLDAIGDEIEKRGADITAIGSAETGLPTIRLEGERGRTVGQMRLFARHIEAGDYLDRRTDGALPDRQPLPRPELRLMQVPVGPVAVFGASNFPLAFSTAGGDTASALAAGCPVVVKGHSAHPGTSEIVADAILAAIISTGMPPGVFSQIQGGDRSVGTSLVQNENIAAVGFTGSLRGGRALFDLCARRPTPIPFFGELGSVNPVFILENALANRAGDIARGWTASLTMGAGQFCTNPGVCVVPDQAALEEFRATAKAALAETGDQTMLTDGIAQAFRDGRDRVAGNSSVHELLAMTCQGRTSAPGLFETDAQSWLDNPELQEEVFGPAGLIVVANGPDQMTEIARALHGQLTCTLHYDDADRDQARALLPILTRKAGRLLGNGFPTGVEVADSMVHGGPYPASTNFGATSVGTLAIRRFLRPVCFQNLSADVLPEDIG